MFVGAAIILATIIAVLLIHRGARVLLPATPEEDTKELAASILFRVSALHGLVLALVFASEVVEYHQLELESASEVNAVSDIYFDVSRYGAEDAAAVQGALIEYLEVVTTQEWDRLGRDAVLHPQAWAAWETVYQAILNLEPELARQQKLQDNMLRKIHLIAENRDLREYHAKSGLNLLFWFAAIAGVALVSAAYFSFRPKRDNVILLSIFGAYTGFILFTIFAMSNPFRTPAALEPALFEDLLQELTATGT